MGNEASRVYRVIKLKIFLIKRVGQRATVYPCLEYRKLTHIEKSFYLFNNQQNIHHWCKSRVGNLVGNSGVSECP